MANRNEQTKVLVAKVMQSSALDSKKWIIVLNCLNAIDQCLPNFYIF